MPCDDWLLRGLVIACQNHNIFIHKLYGMKSKSCKVTKGTAMWVNVVDQTRRKDGVTPAYKLTIALEMKLSSMIFKLMKIKMNGMLLA